METSLKYLVFFEHQNNIILFWSLNLNNNCVEKNISIQQTLFFSFLKRPSL